MNDRWYASLYTGIFRQFGPIPPRPNDPDVSICSGALPSDAPSSPGLAVGGAGWTGAEAEAACVGEAVERLFANRHACDRILTASYSDWPLSEAAIEPDRWVLFHKEQYDQPGFPFRPLTTDTVCAWVCFREALSGEPRWVPAEFGSLFHDPDEPHPIGPALSTGLACARTAQEALLRGLQEVIERDAFVGAWWARYALEAWDARDIFDTLGGEVAHRVLRPNLQYRFFRIATPYSAHVTLVTLEGEDHEGYCFSIGAACRETRAASWRKALLEAIQGRHYVRYLKGRLASSDVANVDRLTDFADHAVYYSVHPEQLDRTVLAPAAPPTVPATSTDVDQIDTLRVLAERLGGGRPVLFRHATAPSISESMTDWVVVRVLVPGLQPLHGNHHLPFIGGPLWLPRGLAEWRTSPPHPFP